MGPSKKGYNYKARQQSTPSEKLSKECEKLKDIIEINTGDDDQSYIYKNDTSNALVMPMKGKVKEKKVNFKEKQKVKLTKKQQRKIQRVIDMKKKKEKREEILKSLSEHQVSSEELSMFKSTSKLGQNESVKRKLESPEDDEMVSATRKRKRKRGQKKNKNNILDKADNVITGEVKTEISSEDDQDQNDDIDKSSSNEDEGQSDNENIISKGGDNDDDDDDDDDDEIFIGENIENEIGYIKEETNSETIKEKETDTLNTNIDTLAETENKNESKQEKESKVSKSEQNSQCKKQPIYVQVGRTKEIQASRLLLPILPEEQVVMETINENDVVVICGSTGSGKTTQVPQFLYEAGYSSHSSRPGMIGITEPRRVAAVSMSKRVATEMNLENSQVSYQIRYEGNTTDKTKIKFMTDGVLLKEMEIDFVLTKYSALIIDEAHERSVFTDILIGLLSRVVPLRRKQNNPLKLIIMSATLRVEDFTLNTRLFPKPPPVLKIDARQYPVTIHFNKRTQDDYVTEAYKKVCKIHRTLKPDGGILVFLTGQNEVLALCRKLRQTFSSSLKKSQTKMPQIAREEYDEKTEDGPKTINLDNYPSIPDEIGYNEDEVDIEKDGYDEDDEDTIESSEDDENRENKEKEFSSAFDNDQPLYVLPLYSVLSSRKQAKVFQSTSEGCRLCVVATNVAETSLTIPGIKYIVDSGKVKRKFYDKITGVSTFRIVWTSKASANQRAGRAGRIGPGHCYRLYSSAVFQNDFEEFSEPEILGRPVEDLLLQMKGMCIDHVVNFPFPSSPDPIALKTAEKLLTDLAALKTQKDKNGKSLSVITAVGKNLSKIPVLPRYAKLILLASKDKDCLQYIIAIVAALTVKEIFSNDIDLSDVPEEEKEDASKRRALITAARRRWAGDGPSSSLGDMMVILRAVGACEFASYTETFCQQNGLRHKAMVEIRKLRAQLTNAVKSLKGCADIFVNPKMPPPSNQQAENIRRMILSCFGDHVARKIPPEEAKSLKLKNAYMSCSSDDPVFIHPTSSLFTKLPEYVVYQEIMETSKLYMKGVISIRENWLPVLVPYMCSYGKPQEEPEPCYDKETETVKCYRSATYGPHVWSLQAELVEYPECTDRYRWFARFILEGEVFNVLKQFSTHLITPASVMIKSWSHLQKKSEDLLLRLANADIDSKAKLRKKFKEQPTFLLKEYLKWIDESKHQLIRQSWPPAD